MQIEDEPGAWPEGLSGGSAPPELGSRPKILGYMLFLPVRRSYNEMSLVRTCNNEFIYLLLCVRDFHHQLPVVFAFKQSHKSDWGI